MNVNQVKRTILSGGTALGAFVVEFATPGLPRIIAAAGADFVVYDMEHSGFGIETIKSLLAATRATDLMPAVRVPATEYHFIARALDAGAVGIMVPMVEHSMQALRIASAAKYPPVGRRGAAFGVAHDDYLGRDVVDAMRSANAETLLIAQIESAAGVTNVDEIAAVEGIDVLWVGHFDLTNSLGIPGQFDHPTYLAALESVRAACRKHGKATGFMPGSPAEARKMRDLGFNVLAFGTDALLYRDALGGLINSSRQA